MKKPQTPGDAPADVIDSSVTAEAVADHLSRCPSCLSLLEGARKAGPTAMAVWRREFARCFSSKRR